MTVLKFIKTIRESFVGSVEVYTQGSCYHFYTILKTVFPQAEAYYDSNHVITKIGKKFYDITGEVEKENHLEMTKYYPECEVALSKFALQEVWDDAQRSANKLRGSLSGRMPVATKTPCPLKYRK